PPVRRAVRPGGRVDLRRRRGHAAHHRAVPAEPQPQPGAVPRRYRTGPARLSRCRGGGVARGGGLRPPGHPRPQRRPRAIRPAPGERADPDHDRGRDNVRRAAGATDARGRRLEVIEVDCRSPGGISYLNFYLPNGGVVVPVAGSPEDEAALAQITAVFGGREVVPVRGRVLKEGGGGPHCITQQIPAGTPLAGARTTPGGSAPRPR